MGPGSDPAVVAVQPQRRLHPAGWHSRSGAGRQHQDGGGARRRGVGRTQRDLPPLRDDGALSRRPVLAVQPGAQGQGRAHGTHWPRPPRPAEPAVGQRGGIAGCHRHGSRTLGATSPLPGHRQQRLGSLAGRTPASRSAADPAAAVRPRCHPCRRRRRPGPLRGPSVFGAVRPCRSPGRTARRRWHRADPGWRLDRRRASAPYRAAPGDRPGTLRGPQHADGDRPDAAGTGRPAAAELAAMPVERRPIDLYAALAEVAR